MSEDKTNKLKPIETPLKAYRIGKTTYRVSLYFSKTSKEAIEDKIKRLIEHDPKKKQP